MNTVVWSNTSLAHLNSIRAYIEQSNPQAAQEVAAALIEAGNSLEHFPQRGRIVPGTDKRDLVTVYPYTIRYRIVGNAIRILRVRHTSRQPTNP